MDVPLPWQSLDSVCCRASPLPFPLLEARPDLFSLMGSALPLRVPTCFAMTGIESQEN